MSTCIVIPSFNENENINLLLDEIHKIDLKDFYIVIVDDSNESFQNQIKFVNERIYYIHRGKKLGRGSAILHGISHMINLDKNIELFVEMDADMSHHPNELLRNIDFFKKKKFRFINFKSLSKKK